MASAGLVVAAEAIVIGIVIARAGVIRPELFQRELAGHAAYLSAKAEQERDSAKRAELERAAEDLALTIENVPFDLARRTQ